MYNQLLREGPCETYEERRVNLLKSQVIQLERQIMLDMEALSKRSMVILEVENILERITEQFRDLLGSETPGPKVTIERSQLTRLIEDTEGARRRLYRSVETSDTKHLAQPALFMGEFLKPIRSDQSEISLLDVCRGHTDHLNLRHVSKLESKLFSLLKKLLVLQHDLTTAPSSTSAVSLPAAKILQDRSESLLATTLPLLAECCQNLMELSLLVPAAPWPALRKSIHPEITSESVLSALPSFPRSKQKQALAVVDALLKANNYSREVAKLEYKACSEELRFHQDVYDLHMEYTRAIFDALKESYQIFEKDMKDSICMPLLDILAKFNTLKDSSSEEALKSFLSSFKDHADELQDCANSMQTVSDGSSHETNPGIDGLSAYGEDFFKRVGLLIAKYSKMRKELLEKVEEAKKLGDLQLEDTLGVVTPNGANV
ncbi:uncharacterized protein [Apostichopus japonicus]